MMAAAICASRQRLAGVTERLADKMGKLAEISFIARRTPKRRTGGSGSNSGDRMGRLSSSGRLPCGLAATARTALR
jgi:hypothetical protein